MALPPKRILLVDDNFINRDLCVAFLGPAGHELVLASDGLEAVRIFQRDIFDLVLMDVQMSGLDGLAATRIIRALRFGSDTPIIAMTADVLSTQIDQCFLSGMNGYISKPFTAKALQSIVDEWGNVELRRRQVSQLPSSTSLEALRERFVGRCKTEADELRCYLQKPTVSKLVRVHSIIHRLAGTAASLDFDVIGAIAVVMNKSIAEQGYVLPTALDALLQTLDELCVRPSQR